MANRIRICAVVSISLANTRSARALRPARISATASSTATSAKPVSNNNRAGRPVDSSENNSDSRITAPKSAIDAAAMISWPVAPPSWPESLSTGTTSPSDVEHRMIAMSSGAEANPPAASSSATTTAIAKDTTKPVSARISGRPRSLCTSISRPARNSRNARPIRASTWTGASTCTQPSSEGPSTMPATISSTGEGTRNAGTALTTSGATNATTTMISRLVKCIASHLVFSGG